MSDPAGQAKERALLVGLTLPADSELHEPELTELARLVETAGAEVVERLSQKRPTAHPATCVGKGKALEIRDVAAAFDVDLIVFDRDLTPAQQRNLEKVTGRKVIDRSEVILDIFARRAQTREARVQVELAQLEYLRPRLRRMWTHLSRIKAGIGMRGPGEKQLEVDRRILQKRIGALKADLVEIERQHRTRSAAREGFFAVSIVGYTNAGKSTLLRALTGEEVFIEDRLFATLDTTTRAWQLPGGKRVFLSDTVGFIRGLPHHLVASFHATLNEARDADLLLHVIDASNPDADSQAKTVTEVLGDVGAGAVPRLDVLNKIDCVEDRFSLGLFRPVHGRSVAVSARTGEGLDELETAVLDILAGLQVEVEIVAHSGNGRLLASLAEKGEVVSREYLENDEVRIRVRLARRDVDRFAGGGGGAQGIRSVSPSRIK